MKETALKIVELLEQEYPEALCSLEYEKDYELLFATRLAAQCTDERVNKVTPTLYSRYPSLEALAEAKLESYQQILEGKTLDDGEASQLIQLIYLREILGSEIPVKMTNLGETSAEFIIG